MGKLCNMVCFIHNKKKTGCMLRGSQYTAGLLLLCPCFFDKFTRRIRISLLLRILLFPYHRSGRASRPADLQKLFRERYLRPDPHFRVIGQNVLMANPSHQTFYPHCVSRSKQLHHPRLKDSFPIDSSHSFADKWL